MEDYFIGKNLNGKEEVKRAHEEEIEDEPAIGADVAGVGNDKDVDDNALVVTLAVFDERCSLADDDEPFC